MDWLDVIGNDSHNDGNENSLHRYGNSSSKFSSGISAAEPLNNMRDHDLSAFEILSVLPHTMPSEELEAKPLPRQQSPLELLIEGLSESEESEFQVMKEQECASCDINNVKNGIDDAQPRNYESRISAVSSASRHPSQFSILSTYKWGSNKISESSSNYQERSSDQREERNGGGSSNLTDGIDDGNGILDDDDKFVIISADDIDLEEAEEAIEKATRASSAWGFLGASIFSVANKTTQTAGSVIYYATNALEETSNHVLVEARANLSRSTDVAVLAVAGGMATETLLFAVDRGRLLSHHVSNMIRGDPAEAQRMHLRRLLASGSWAEFSLKCQFATLPWYDRQLISVTRDIQITGKSTGQSLTRRDKVVISNEKTKTIVSSKITSSSAFLAKSSKSDSMDDYKASQNNSRNIGSGEESPSDLENGLKPLIPYEINDDVDEAETEFQKWIISEAAAGNDDAEYALAKWFTPPSFVESIKCSFCDVLFGISKFRHHCRHCGQSFCSDHSPQLRPILKYGMIHPVRVCDRCASVIDKESKMDRRRWRKQRLDDYSKKMLLPYFEAVVDTGADKAYRIGLGTLYVVRNAGMALTYPAVLAAESLEILRKYGLIGIAGILLRKDFVEAVEVLKQLTSMDERYPLSIRQMTACIYYKLAIERGLRGCDPNGEFRSHGECGEPPGIRGRVQSNSGVTEPIISQQNYGIHLLAKYIGPDRSTSVPSKSEGLSSGQRGVFEDSPYARSNLEADRLVSGQCRNIDDTILHNLIRYSSLALLISYEVNAVECQRLAALQGFQLLIFSGDSDPEKPAFSIYSSSGDNELSGLHIKREAVLVIRGTHTIQDVVTDLRATPIVFPPSKEDIDGILSGRIGIHDCNSPTSLSSNSTERKLFAEEIGWTAPAKGIEYACRGIARAALFILAEAGPSIIELYQTGHDVKIIGHSLGGAVSALVALLLRDYIPDVHALAYSPPCCISSGLADELEKITTTCVLHDDIICRVTPESIRLLMKELMVFRDQVFKYVEQDWHDAIKRAASVWTPRWRETSFNSLAPKSNKPQESSSFVARGVMNSRSTASDSQRVSLPALESVAGSDSKPISNGSCLLMSTSNAEISTNDEYDDDDSKYCEEDDDDINDSSDGALMINPATVAKLWLPGRIMHIYMHRGVYRIAEVPRSFPSLRRIEIQGDIFNDHTSRTVYDALLEVRSVRNASTQPPVWTPYDASVVCQRCNNSFTWHTTFQGDAQELRERFNCRSCGALVCGPCSAQNLPVNRLGLIQASKICDSCFHLGHYAAPFNPHI